VKVHVKPTLKFLGDFSTPKIAPISSSRNILIQNPNLSAIADRNPKEIASLKNSLIAFYGITPLF